MNDVFLGLGSNLGDRIENLRQAIRMLEPHLVVEKKSSVYESLPFGVTHQPNYFNMAVRGQTDLAPQDLLRELKVVERNMGRAVDTHQLPRPIDIDIIFYGEHIVDMPELVIPHREMHLRAFVLVPLDEIASFYIHPKQRKPVVDLLDELGGYDEVVWLAQEQL